MSPERNLTMAKTIIKRAGGDAACFLVVSFPVFACVFTVFVGFFFLGAPQGHAYERRSDDYAVTASAAPTGMRVELLPRWQTTLSSEIAARILKIAPREGHRFKQGDALVTFDCAMEKAQMQRARAILEAAEAKSQVNDRLSHLQATSQLEERVARAEAAQARAELAIIRVKINRCKIQAPFSGRVVTRFAKGHQYVKAGDPLMEILDEQSLEVVFLLPSRQRHQWTQGSRFQVRIDETRRSYPARITTFGAMIDSVSQSVKVFGAMDGHFPDLLPGMSGVAHFPSGSSAPVREGGPTRALSFP